MQNPQNISSIETAKKDYSALSYSESEMIEYLRSRENIRALKKIKLLTIILFVPTTLLFKEYIIFISDFLTIGVYSISYLFGAVLFTINIFNIMYGITTFFSTRVNSFVFLNKMVAFFDTIILILFTLYIFYLY